MSSTPDDGSAPERLWRFVILQHTGYGQPHWDLMFEQDETLATWKVYHEPEQLTKAPVEVFRIPDHRQLYLDYEGPVSGGRGQVRRVCAGTYELLKKCDHCWQVRLNAEPIVGAFELGHREDQRWLIRRLDLAPEAKSG